MKNISLIKVTFLVVATALASPLVSATDATPQSISTIGSPATKSIQFEQLDLDKNGLLNLSETETNKQVHDAFTKIDSNGDATISEEEFAKFVNK